MIKKNTSQALLLLAVVLIGAAGCGKDSITPPTPDIELAEKFRAGGEGTAAGPTTAVATGTGWGTLKGVFKYGGSAPAQGFLSTGGKDAATCGQQVPEQSLLIDSSGGIANILVYARRVSRRFEGEPLPDNMPVFDQKKCLFLSPLFCVQTAQTINILNSDPVAHNVNISPPGNPSANLLLGEGGTATYKFSRQLTDPTTVVCNIHPWMKAYMMARDDAYFAVTAADGSFEIPNLPAGEPIEFQVWHERAPGGLAARPDWSRGRVTLQVPQDGENNLGEIQVPTGAFQ